MLRATMRRMPALGAEQDAAPTTKMAKNSAVANSNRRDGGEA
jgi:hypothetical protein